MFPSERTRTDCMSDSSLRFFGLVTMEKPPVKVSALPTTNALPASSILNEQGFNLDAIERQLAHLERNSVRAT